MVKPREEFTALLGNSRSCAEQVLGWLLGWGYDARLLPSSTTPDEASRWQYVDNGDIEIRLRVEIKHWPRIDFNSLEDVPYRDIIVDESYKVDKYHPSTLHGYVILNKPRTACLFIPAITRKHWFRKDVFDKREGETRNFVFCPKSKVIFYNRGQIS